MSYDNGTFNTNPSVTMHYNTNNSNDDEAISAAGPLANNGSGGYRAGLKVVAGYGLHQRLGSGSFATVYKGVKVSPNNTPGAETVAIKAINRTSEKLTKKVLQNLEIEISILQTYRHRNIVCLQDVQKTERHFYLILEYCQGGDLQQLIRTRKTGRLSERLTRRLMRDLSAGLRFLWRQELVHRDIKPQNLLLTGALPLDEVNDPERTDEMEEQRRKANSPSDQFALKIADFGFARHLQNASLAETLCGSPLYMAPEILSHHRYDAKADLWSVGTVLFEMISGKPPFHGENHIDLLRNIQRKAVRLPPEVKVSKPCVNLLRLLLNRNPLSRAGFKEFFEACDTFVAMGCGGVATVDNGFCKPTRRSSKNLGTIHENTAPVPLSGSDSIMTVQTMTHQQPYQQQQQQQQQQQSSPPSATGPPPSPYLSTPPLVKPVVRNYPVLAPLEPSPPSSGRVLNPPNLPNLPSLDLQRPAVYNSQQQHAQISWQNAPQHPNVELTQFGQHQQQQQRKNDGSLLQNSSGDDSGFVMVEYGQTQSPGATAIVSPSSNNNYSNNSNNNSGENQYQRRSHSRDGNPSPNSSRYYMNTTTTSAPTPPATSNRGEYMMVNNNNNNYEPAASHRAPKGMLSTSPGTGGLLLGMIGGRRISYNHNSSNDATVPNTDANVNKNNHWETQIEAASKLLATSEDVGRRAISVAHLGDTRAVLALRMALMNEGGSSLLSVTPMEGVEEEMNDDIDENNGPITDGSNSREIMAASRRRPRAVSTDKSMTEVNKQEEREEEEAEEMPFACVSQETSSASTSVSPQALPSQSSRPTVTSFNKNSRNLVRPTGAMVQAHFKEALSCYLKALQMLKGAVTAAHNVEKDLEAFLSQQQYLSFEQRNRVQSLNNRCGVTAGWLSGQFNGVLERGDAANVEISKLEPSVSRSQPTNSQKQSHSTDWQQVTSVEELMYNHALVSGREGAVKQLLGQYEAARSCYRTAGLLAETLLMKPNIETGDRNILEEYVDGFAARITELDSLMLQQSRLTGSSAANSSSIGAVRRGSDVVGLVGQPLTNQRPPFSTANIAAK